MGHFNTPPSSVKFKGLVGVNAHVRSNEGVPGAIALLVEEELYIPAGISCLDGGAGVANGSVPLCSLGLLKPFDDVRSTEVAQGGLVLGLAHLDHSDDVALEVPAMDEQEQLCTREPAVNQQVAKAEALNDGSPEHLDGVGNFGLKHLLLTGVDFLVLAALLAVLGILLLLGKPLWFTGILAALCLYCGIHHQLSLAVSVAEEHGLDAHDALHRSVRKHLPKPLSLHASFRKVSVIEDDTTGISFCVSPAADEPNELAVDGVDNATPVDTAIVHQAIERVLLAGEEFAQGTVGVVRRYLHGEERQHNKQLHQLNEGELAVRILKRTHRFGLYDEPFHHVVYRVDCPAGVVVLEKVFEFRDYLSIFVHG